MKFHTILGFSVCLVLVLGDDSTSSEHHHQTHQTEEKEEPKESEESFRSILGGISAGSSNANKGRDLSALKEVIASGNWDRFTPPPVSSPNCHVEVQVVQKIPGRCIQLGRHQIPACQTQNWVSFNSEDCAGK